MKLRTPTALDDELEAQERSYAWLGRQAGRSRQFIRLLATGDKPCSLDLARKIEEVLALDEGAIFVPSTPREERELSARPADDAA